LSLGLSRVYSCAGEAFEPEPVLLAVLSATGSYNISFESDPSASTANSPIVVKSSGGCKCVAAVSLCPAPPPKNARNRRQSQRQDELKERHNDAKTTTRLAEEEISHSGESWVLYFRTTRKSDRKRVENKIPIGPVCDLPDKNSAWAEVSDGIFKLTR
jgi:hypothetical protein